uniref:Uncharacterized protein n=1 Tax=Anguilla anguilla TaxID=7936 RepID=A0A0E9XZU9_ANGAN
MSKICTVKFQCVTHLLHMLFEVKSWIKRDAQVFKFIHVFNLSIYADVRTLSLYLDI